MRPAILSWMAGRFVPAATAVATVLVTAASATASDAASGDALIRRGAKFDYRAETVPPPVRALGLVAIAGLDVAAGFGRELPSALGSFGVPDGFPSRKVAGEVGRAPFGVKDGKKCKCSTDLGSGRVAVLYASREFHVDDPDAAGVLELSARYQDGIAAYINGREVARRNLADDRSPVALARRKHGSEWERFQIQVVPGLLHKGRNVLSVEVRPSGHRTGPFLDLELHRRPDVRLVRGPIVQRPSDGGAVLRFTTDRPVRGAVEWGTSRDALDNKVASARGTLAIQHRVALSPQVARSGFYYRVRAGKAVSKLYRVAPFPAAGQPIRFAVYGDMRGGHEVHRKLVESIERDAPDFVVVTGDLVQRGSDGGDWQKFFSVAGTMLARIPYFPVAGNHDVGRSGAERRLMSELFELPSPPTSRPYWGNWYSFEIGGLHFVMLDSNNYEHEGQKAWLKTDLEQARARGVRAIFAATHDGPFSRGHHRGNRYAQEHYVPLLAKHGVAMLFAGHDHLYQRGEISGLKYIVSGGGGAPLYSIRCGVKGRKRCKVKDGMQHIERAHHYVTVSVTGKRAQVCAKNPDGTALEKCVWIGL